MRCDTEVELPVAGLGLFEDAGEGTSQSEKGRYFSNNPVAYFVREL